jgi:uncharacterized membrane protein YdjX (TVP38/TMEM64 family)
MRKDPLNLPPNGKPRAPWPAWARWLVGLALVAAVLLPLVWWYDDIAALLENRDQIAAMVRSSGAWGALLMVVLQAAQVVIAPIPGQVTNFLAGYIFGFLPGALLAWLGTIIGATLAMTLARFAGRPLVERLVSPRTLARLDALAEAQGLRFFFLAFLLPLLPDDAICLMAGLTPLPLSALILAAAIGRLPGLTVTVWAGAHVGEMPSGLLVIAGAVSLILLALAWRYDERIETALLERVSRWKQWR